ncbi:hypothetical protein PPYR_02294 [Photinus pyralis]|uniref:YqaJ viral recombinase domain-containing protein n=1 Tax=Photinus pyralis TaxID=7054 RepID=A0A5N4B6Y8_PHOPY|nr:hypothetical protein PPYR_02294 [Photinus pyralis]
MDRGRFPPSLFKTLTGSYNLDGVKQIQWGRYNEKKAIEKFQEQYNVTVTPTGIWFSKEGVIGASPDGLIGENELIEIKCPFRYKDSNFKTVLSVENGYILKYVDNDFFIIPLRKYCLFMYPKRTESRVFPCERTGKLFPVRYE